MYVPSDATDRLLEVFTAALDECGTPDGSEKALAKAMRAAVPRMVHDLGELRRLAIGSLADGVTHIGRSDFPRSIAHSLVFAVPPPSDMLLPTRIYLSVSWFIEEYVVRMLETYLSDMERERLQN